MKAGNAAADFEQTKVAFTTLLGDAAKAEELLAMRRDHGAKTAFEFPELADTPTTWAWACRENHWPAQAGGPLSYPRNF